jgi:DNA polymerase-3 subunit beta
MKITTTKNELLPALLQAGSIIERRQTLPILANILVNVNQEIMTLVATDLELEVKTRIRVEADENMDFTIPARKITEICKALNDGAKITLDVSDDKVVLRSGRGRYTLSTLPAADYPNMEVAVATQQLTIPQGKLKQLLEKTAFAMAQQDVRYYLNGMLFEGIAGKLRTVATDGHRLALCETELQSKTDLDLQAIVPRKAVLELNRLLVSGKEAPPVELQFSSGFMKVEFPDSSFATKLIDGRYPDYAKVIPTANTQDLLADRNLLKQALTRTAILSNEKFRGVRFKTQAGLLNLTAHNPEHEEAEEELEVDFTGDEMTIGFNVGYLLDVLGVLDDERIRMGLIDPASSCVITSENADGADARYVVMPMRI